MFQHYKPPVDAYAGTWVGRAWLPGSNQGPAVVVVRPEGVFDVTGRVATTSALFDLPDPAALLRRTPGERIGGVEEILRNSDAAQQDASKPWFLAPIDLQAIKAAGVTFAASLLERIVEEHAKGEPVAAEGARAALVAEIGVDLSKVRPGSPRGRGPEASPGPARPLVAIPGSGHRAGRRGLHQGAAPVRRGLWRGYRRSSQVRLEQPGAGGGARRLQQRPDRRSDARQRRQPARLRGPQRVAAVQGQGQQRLDVHRPVRAPVRRDLLARRCAPGRGRPARGGGGRVRARRDERHGRDQPRPGGPRRPDYRRHAPVSRRVRPVPRHHVRADQGAGKERRRRVHAQDRRRRRDQLGPARHAGQPRPPERPGPALALRRARPDCEPRGPRPPPGCHDAR